MKIKHVFTGLVLTMFLVAGLLVLTPTADGATRVRGYYRSNGTYVMPHYRSNYDSYRSNNWSSYGNYNPYTGKRGYRSYQSY